MVETAHDAAPQVFTTLLRELGQIATLPALRWQMRVRGLLVACWATFVVGGLAVGYGALHSLGTLGRHSPVKAAVAAPIATPLPLVDLPPLADRPPLRD